MIKMAKYLLLIAGITSVLLFGVSATAGMTSVPNAVGRFFSESITMVLQGIVLIGLGSIIKSRSNGQ